MMATKPTTSLRDRRLPASSPLHHSSSASRSARPSPKTPLSSGVNKSPAEVKKPVPNYLKPRNVPSSDLLISLNPASPKPKPSSSFRINGDKAAPSFARSVKTSPFLKAKSTSPAPVKKKAPPVIIATTFPQIKLSSDHEAVITTERLEQEQSQNNPKKIAEALNNLNNVEESTFISSPIVEENHIGEPEYLDKQLEPLVFDEVLKEPLVFKEVPELVEVVVVATTVEKRDEGKKVEEVEAVERRVESEVRKPRLAIKKKDAPRSNDMIEETKSKLMGTRKNRVLALVGAFETVISLQEPEAQQNQKAHQVLQVEQSFEDSKIQQNVASRQIQEVQNAQQLERGDEVHQEKGNEDDNTMLKEMVNEALAREDKGEDEVLKEEEADEALESAEKEEDALGKEEEANDVPLQNGKVEEHPLQKEEALQTSSMEKEECTESMQEERRSQ